jgi:transcriptional regulator GlxA family with amidase domain
MEMHRIRNLWKGFAPPDSTYSTVAAGCSAMRVDSALSAIRWSISLTVVEQSVNTLMSRRTFTRHFRQLTGNTVGAWLLGERLARSQQLLEVTDRPVEQVAVLAGFGSAASMRQHFQRAFGITPSVWRQGFRGN